jgi:hypothetical protein
MIKIVLSFFVALTNASNTTVEFTAHKILMTGSLEPYEHKYYFQVAQALARNNQTRNEVYMLHYDKHNPKQKFEITKKEDRLYYISIPEALADPRSIDKQRRFMRQLRFTYDATKTEEENFISLDAEHVAAYFQEGEDGNLELIEFLKKQNFNVAIGTLYLADSLLFRAMDINYLKIHPEDFEGYTMFFKQGMPVQLSAYPNARVYSNWEYYDLPHEDTQRFRWKSFKDTFRMRWARYWYLAEIRNNLSKRLHNLMDDWDQDHAMFISEGTNHGLIQSIMMKPANVKPVYPLRYEKPKEYLEMSPVVDTNPYTGKKGPLIIWNLELLDPRGAMYAFGGEENDVDYFLRAFRELPLMFRKDFDLVILVPPSQADNIQKIVDKYEFYGNYHVKVHGTEDPFNVDFTAETYDFIEQWTRPLVWMSQCTQPNFIQAIETMGAAFVGYANEDKSYTQTFNCHKVVKHKMGTVVQLEDVHKDAQPRNRLFAAIKIAIE